VNAFPERVILSSTRTEENKFLYLLELKSSWKFFDFYFSFKDFCSISKSHLGGTGQAEVIATRFDQNRLEVERHSNGL
jgi:hypothetical protein